MEDLQVLWERLNRRFFEGTLPPCRIEWSRRLTRAAGNIDVRKRRVKLSVPLLIEAFENNSAHQVLGVRCEDSAGAIEEVLKHEAIHLWLFERGLPHGHTPQFRQKAREIGQPRTRHAIARPLPRTGWVYTCAGCGAQIVRRKRFAAARACARCCRAFSNGKFDARFKLSARRIAVDKGS